MKAAQYSLIILFVCLLVSTAFGQTTPNVAPEGTDVKSMVRPRSVTKLTFTPQETNPFDTLRTGKVIFVTSTSLLVREPVIEEKLQKRHEFAQLGLIITRDPSAADIILELHHDVFTKYVYTAIDRRTEFVLTGGKLSSLGGTVAAKVAERFLKQMVRARTTQPGP